MTRHTPGPWMTADSDPTFVYALGDDGFNRFCAHVQDAHTSRAELEANARLIAAAPKLLKACEMLVECMRLANWESDPAAKKGRAAIKKATGNKP